MCPCSPTVSLRAYLESLADHAGTAVPAADGALRALVGHVLLQVARQHSLVAQVTLDLLEPTLLHVGLGEEKRGRGWGHVLYERVVCWWSAHIDVLQQPTPTAALVSVVAQNLHLGDLLAACYVRVVLRQEGAEWGWGVVLSARGEVTLPHPHSAVSQLTSCGSTFILQSSQTWPGILEGKGSAHHTEPQPGPHSQQSVNPGVTSADSSYNNT